jgi:predicted signal transduction protein with EAL and GGDEF domain
MYHAKDSGRDRVVLFDREMRESLVERLALQDEFRHGIDNDELRVVYQPLFDLGTDRVIGFEALVRWEHPTRGLMAPDDFLPIAEQLGLVMRIDSWVLRTAAAQLESWSEELVDAEHWGVAVNASAPNFADPSYPKRIRSILDDTGLDPSRARSRSPSTHCSPTPRSPTRSSKTSGLSASNWPSMISEPDIHRSRRSRRWRSTS